VAILLSWDQLVLESDEAKSYAKADTKFDESKVPMNF